MIIADNNLVVYLFVEGPHSEETRAVLKQEEAWMVPPLWRSEFLNAMLGYIRQDALTEAGAVRYFEEAEAIVQMIEPPRIDTVLHLAVQHRLSAYDATYAALARHLGVQHVTYDGQVLRAGLGIHPRDFLSQAM